MPRLSVPYPNRRPPKVKVAVPFYDSFPEMFTFIVENLVHQGIPGYNVSLVKRPSTIIQFARNELVDEPVGLDWDYLFFLDDDLGFESDKMSQRVPATLPDGRNVQIPLMNALMKRILDHGKAICAGWYCQRGGKYLPLVFDQQDREGYQCYVHRLDPPSDGLEEVGAVATGFLCIHRDVFRAFNRQFDERLVIDKKYRAWREANPDFSMPDELRDYLDRCAKADLHDPFWLDKVWDPTNKRWMSMGEDLFFCREATKLGFQIWVDWSVWLGHETKFYLTPDHYRNNSMAERIAEQDAFYAKENGGRAPVDPVSTEDTANRLKAAGLVPAEAANG